jgi:hypothetical protein
LEQQMNLSGLERLGRIAGIGGISIGAVVLLFNALIGTIPGLPADQQADIVRLLAILCFGIGVIGVIAWFASGRPAIGKVMTRGSQSPATSAKGKVDISYAGTTPEHSGASRSSQTTRSPSDAAVQTRGDQSPAVLSGADVAVRYGPGTPTTSRRKRNKPTNLRRKKKK